MGATTNQVRNVPGLHGSGNASVTISAQNQWTDPISLGKGGYATLSINSLSDSTVTLQRKIDGTNWRDVDTWTADAEEDYYASESQDIRLGVATGDYGTDSPVLRVGS